MLAVTIQGEKRMKAFNGLAAFWAIAALSSLSGCVIAPDRGGGGGERDHDRYRYDNGGYRYENGDRVDREGHREARWCDGHRDDEHCR
jgi:hypothetical protein